MATNSLPEALRSFDDDEDSIASALGEVTPKDTRAAEASPEPRHGVWLGSMFLGVLGAAAFYTGIRMGFFDFLGKYLPFVRRLSIGVMAILLTFGLARTADYLWIRKVRERAARYNLRRILRLVQILVVAVIAISILFANWYTAVVSLGLISLVLGFALQTPITSFIAWIYILVRKPYRVGDRIGIGDATGDVIEVNYLDTTLWEFGGPYLSTDQPSGRIIKFPNSNVLSSSVFNYSWALFPYIWNEVKLQIAYNSDLKFVGQTMQSIAEGEIGSEMIARVAAYRKLLEQTPVDEISVQEKPTVFFRVSENTWIEAIVRYLVEPKSAATVKTRLIEKMLAALNAEPGRVLFPKGENR